MAFSSSTMRMRPGMPSLLRERQRHLELGAAADRALDLDRAGVRLDDLLRDRHAEPGAVVLGGEERIEDAVDLLRRDALPVVAHAHRRLPSAVLDVEVEPAALG